MSADRSRIARACWTECEDFRPSEREGMQAEKRYAAHESGIRTYGEDILFEITDLQKNHVANIDLEGIEGEIYMGIPGDYAEAYASKDIVETTDDADFGDILKAISLHRSFRISFERALQHLQES